MSALSERIKAIIEENDETIVAISERSNLERSTIQKVKSGQRLPTQEFLVQFTNAMRLSQAEERLLWELFEVEKNGVNTTNNRKSIKAIIEMIAELTEYKIPFAKKTDKIDQIGLRDSDDSEKILHGKQAVTVAIENLIDYEIYSSKTPNLKMVSAFNQSFVHKHIFKMMIGNQKRLKIDEIICFPESLDSKETEEDLIALKTRIGISLLENIHFNANFTNLQDFSPQGKQNGIAFFILAEKEVIMIARDYQSAVIYRKKQKREEAEKYFFRLFLDTENYIVESENPLLIYGLDENYKTRQAFEPLPCFALYFTEKMIDYKMNKALPFYSELLYATKCHYNYFQKVSKDMINFFSIKSLELFMENGDFMMPKGIIEEINPSERLMLLKLVRKDLAEKRRLIYAVNPDNLFFNSAVEYVVDDRSVRLIFHYPNKHQYVYKVIALKKETTSDAFNDYFLALPDTTDVFSIDETLDQIGRIINKYEKLPAYNKAEDLHLFI